ncbi:MAG TPA: YfiR family protein [Terriglobales bacterium]|nr:YfiR family protein [Terriglobales bacterium]
MSTAAAVDGNSRTRTRYHSGWMFESLIPFRNKACILFTCLLAFCGLAHADRPSEYQVKAAYLYNFGKFVNWPADAGAASEFDVCVLGTDPFGPLLDATVSDSTINGKRVIARRIGRAQDAASCRVVFIAASESQRLGSDLAVLSKLHVLTVSDNAHFLERGGMIQFVLEGDRVRFAVNLSAAQEAGLTLSSELLKVATKVVGNTQVR